MLPLADRPSRVLIDGHLDLADNALRKGRNLTLELDALRAAERRSTQEAMITLPELQRGGIAIVFATLFVMPRYAAENPARTYETPEEARALAIEQLELYLRWEEQGRVRIIRTRSDLESFLAMKVQDRGSIGMVLLMEGAEPVSDPGDLGWWFEQGVRIVGPAWKATRYAGGTGEPGPLTELGVELIDSIGHHGLILDVSHLAEESFWQAMELSVSTVMASHSNSRRFVDSARHLSDGMATAIADRDGTIGLVLANKFLKAGVEKSDPKESVTLADVRAQAEHLAGIVGWDSIAIGSDLDGGFGLQETPLELGRGADFGRLGCIAPKEYEAGVLGENLLRVLRNALPAT